MIKHRHSKNDHPDVQPTHTRIGDESANIYGGSYYISDEDYSEFMKLYFEEIVQKKGTEYLTEKQLTDEFVPIAIDLDLHFSFDKKERLYEDDHITDLIDLYLEEMKKALQFEENSQFPIFIFEKPDVNPVQEKQITKDGLHIIIGVNMSRTGQKILRKNVMKEIESVWTDLPIINSWDEVFDDGITNGYTNWQLYGSCKPHHDKYALTKVYQITYDNNDGEFETTEENPSDYLTLENFPKLSVRYKNHEQYFYTSAFSSQIQAFEQGEKDPKVPRKTVSPKNVDNGREFRLEDLPSINETLEIGKGRVIQEGKKVALLNFGTRLEQCKGASETLLKKGITCTIVDARFAKPLDEKLIMEVASNHEVLITIEEGSIGGFGSHVMQFLSDRGVFDKGLKFRSMILPDIFIDQDTPEKMYEIAGLDSKSIASKVEETLNSNIILAKSKNKNIN